MTTTTHSHKAWTDEGGHVTRAPLVRPETMEWLFQPPPLMPRNRLLLLTLRTASAIVGNNSAITEY